MNIYEKIYILMDEYENLLLNNNKKSKLLNDSFFNFINENIIIEEKIKKENENLENENLENENLENENLENENLDNENLDNENLDNENYVLIKNNSKDKITSNEKNNESDYFNLNEIKKFIKKIYKKIVLKCHPDKNSENSNLFIKCKDYYNDNFLIGILYIAYLLKFKIPPINNIIINRILIEIKIIQYEIIKLKSNN